MSAKKAPKKAAAKVARIARERVTIDPQLAAKVFLETIADHVDIATKVTTVIANATTVGQIRPDSTLAELGFNTTNQLNALAAAINREFPGLGLKGSDLKPTDTVSDVIAIVRKKLHPGTTH